MDEGNLEQRLEANKKKLLEYYGTENTCFMVLAIEKTIRDVLGGTWNPQYVTFPPDANKPPPIAVAIALVLITLPTKRVTVMTKKPLLGLTVQGILDKVFPGEEHGILTCVFPKEKVAEEEK